MHQSSIDPVVAQASPVWTGQRVSPRPVYVLDEDRVTRRETVTWLRDHGFEPRPYLASQDLLDDLSSIRPGCVLVGTLSPEAGLAALIRALDGRLADFPVVVSILPGDVASAVVAMKLGASDVIERAMDRAFLPAVLDPIFEKLRCHSITASIAANAQDALRVLSPREQDILSGVVEGLSSKQIAAILGLNTRTVEMSRSKMMQRLQARTLSDVLRLAFRAGIAPLSERRGWGMN
jgi:two-component system response regulator FixJ